MSLSFSSPLFGIPLNSLSLFSVCKCLTKTLCLSSEYLKQTDCFTLNRETCTSHRDDPFTATWEMKGYSQVVGLREVGGGGGGGGGGDWDKALKLTVYPEMACSQNPEIATTSRRFLQDKSLLLHEDAAVFNPRPLSRRMISLTARTSPLR